MPVSQGPAPSVSGSAARHAPLVGCTAADLAWERNLEQAAIAFQAGDAVMPPVLWARGLDIAERHFASGDPRLACSLTNRAFALRRQGERFESTRCSKTRAPPGRRPGAGFGS